MNTISIQRNKVQGAYKKDPNILVLPEVKWLKVSNWGRENAEKAQLKCVQAKSKPKHAMVRHLAADISIIN